MNLIKENRENKIRMPQSILCGIITGIAVCALIVIAAYIEMPIVLRVLISVFSLIVVTLGIGVEVTLDVRAGYYECPH